MLSYFADAERDTARRQRMVRKALERLGRDGIVEEESAGRYRISPVVEIVLSAPKLRELSDWLRERGRDEVADPFQVADPFDSADSLEPSDGSEAPDQEDDPR
ncbi:hypothetical protein [Rathayibacter iranicus]|uniref:Uncharacterized protein n=1 Tax=Rathayibacter iranicus NCPPB 2253 = VKM Ac-1602 TaxID=1328868 RepID=A0ABX5LAH8_9MICO|nr:hypothetical protein B0H03_11029 [Rathayibacter iranicus NCPPB 2253 = VKM Ac-1602]